jgi:hypothetical protein
VIEHHYPYGDGIAGQLPFAAARLEPGVEFGFYDIG